jgi:hypothetical protein
MKNTLKIIVLVTITFCQFSCKTQIDISPTTATLIVPAKGDLKLFENKQHSSFYINIKNKSVKNSCEAYTLKNGNKKWISPSLPVNGELDFSVPKNGAVLLENYSDENITIIYTID